MKPAQPAPIQLKSSAARGEFQFERTFEVITPVFGGGVWLNSNDLYRHQKDLDRVTPVRTAALRGQLRFWWRATQGTTFASIEALRKAEDALWGNASIPGRVSLRVNSKAAVGQDVRVFRLDVRPGKSTQVRAVDSTALAYGAFPIQPSQQATGQGVEPGVLHAVNGRSTLVLSGPKDAEAEVRAAVDAWLLFGGIGGRTRRGFGAVASVDGVPDPKSFVATWANRRTALPFSTLAGARVVLSRQTFTDAGKAFDFALGRLKDFRQGVGVGRNKGQEHNRPGRSRWPEPDAIRGLTRESAPAHRQRLLNVPKFPRGRFGLPIVFHFKDGGDPRDVNLQPMGAERRASPIILRPIQMGDRSFRAMALYLQDPSAEREQLALVRGRNAIHHHLSATLTQGEARELSPLNPPHGNGDPDPILAFLHFFANA